LNDLPVWNALIDMNVAGLNRNAMWRNA